MSSYRNANLLARILRTPKGPGRPRYYIRIRDLFVMRIVRLVGVVVRKLR